MLVFEDSPSGIEAATRPGMALAFNPDSHMDWKAAIEQHGVHPTLVIQSLEEFDFSRLLWAQPE